MNRPWTAERSVSADLARSLIETQFAMLAPARLEPLGAGWDNSAFLVNGEWVFRFPRRHVAAELIETERRVLPAIEGRLPLPVPVPTMCGRSGEPFPWPFSGYRRLDGLTACRANLSEAQRCAAATPLGRFLAALHAIPTQHVAALGVPPDTLRRLDRPYRAARIAERLEHAAALGLVDDPARWQHVIDDSPDGWTPGDSTLVHGDLYVRHVLVDAAARPAGVIDWGDVHLGDAAVDLSLAHSFLPPSAHDAFRQAYGSIDDSRWRVARFRALHSAAMILVYGHDINDDDLLREGRMALRFLADQ